MGTDLLTKPTTTAAAAPSATVLDIDEQKGIVVAIVAVTGVVDLVEDLIVPGAFTHTKSVRIPKVVDDHVWRARAGRTPEWIELMPGDERLPKFTKDGKPWPAEAGAVLATMQYNLRSKSGRESFEWVRFYAETNEAEFSIGYKVPAGKARQRRDGVRVILEIDLYEFSHVLFGAHPLTMAVEVKDPGMSSMSGGTTTRPVLGGAKPTLTPDDDDPPPAARTSRKAMTAAEAIASARTGVAKKFAEIPHLMTNHDPSKTEGGTQDQAAVDAAGDTTPQKPFEEKSMSNFMSGSMEEIKERIEKSVRDLFCKDDPADGPETHTWVWIRATFPTEVIVTVEKRGDEKNYLIPYTAPDGADGVELGEATEVELSMVAKVAGEESEVEDEETVAEVMADALMSKLVETKTLARFAGVTSVEIRDAAQALFEGLGGKVAPGPGEDPEEDPTDAPPAPDSDTPPAADAPPEAPAADEPAEPDIDDISTPLTGPDLDEPPAEEDETAEKTAPPAPPVEDDVAPEGESAPEAAEMVTIDPEEHAAAMKELGLDDDIEDPEYVA